jgi:hypothetical protein
MATTLRIRLPETGWYEGITAMMITAIVRCLALAGILLEAAQAGIIGNVPLEDMRRNATRIVAGMVLDVVTTSEGNVWSIQVLKTYKGPAATTIIVSGDPRTPEADLKSVRSKRGLFVADSRNALISRTGGTTVRDLYVPLAQELSPAPDVDVAFCIDWMRGLSEPGTLVMRDLAVAASDCARNKDLVNKIRFQIGGSTRSSDALIIILVGIAQSDPAALEALETWLRGNPSLDGAMEENVAWGLFSYASPDARGSSVLRRLALGAQSLRVQEAAAIVLVYIHSDETWTDLAALLDSSRAHIRRLALQGLQQTVDAGERGEPGPFERRLIHLGDSVQRVAKRRSAIPKEMRVPRPDAQFDEEAMVRFWREYASRNR